MAQIVVVLILAYIAGHGIGYKWVCCKKVPQLGVDGSIKCDRVLESKDFSHDRCKLSLHPRVENTTEFSVHTITYVKMVFKYTIKDNHLFKKDIRLVILLSSI